MLDTSTFFIYTSYNTFLTCLYNIEQEKEFEQNAPHRGKLEHQEKGITDQRILTNAQRGREISRTEWIPCLISERPPVPLSPPLRPLVLIEGFSP